MKFVRKKAKRRSLNPIDAVADLFAGPEEGGDTVEVVRPVEERKIGRSHPPPPPLPPVQSGHVSSIPPY